MPVVTSNLAAEYLLREGSGTTAHDTSGNGLDGTTNFSTGSWVSDGVHFTDAFSDQIVIPDAVLANDNTSITDASLEAWVKPDGTDGPTGNIVDLAWGSFNLFQTLSDYAGAAWGGTLQSIRIGSVGATGAVNPAGWQHLVFVRSADVLLFYVNGTLISSNSGNDTSPLDLASTTGEKAIGRSQSDTTFVGTVGEVRIYSAALSGDDVSQNYGATSSRYGGGTGSTPTVSFTASPSTTVIPGTVVTLSWTVTDADSVSITSIGTVSATGTQDITAGSLGDVTTYTLTAINGNGTTTITITITVAAPAIARWDLFVVIDYNFLVGGVVGQLDWFDSRLNINASPQKVLSLNQGTGDGVTNHPVPFTGTVATQIEPSGAFISFTEGYSVPEQCPNPDDFVGGPILGLTINPVDNGTSSTNPTDGKTTQIYDIFLRATWADGTWEDLRPSGYYTATDDPFDLQPTKIVPWLTDGDNSFDTDPDSYATLATRFFSTGTPVDSAGVIFYNFAAPVWTGEGGGGGTTIPPTKRPFRIIFSMLGGLQLYVPPNSGAIVA